MSSSKIAKPIKLKSKIKIRKRKAKVKAKTCDELYDESKENNIVKNIKNKDYQNLLKCVTNNDRELLEDASNDKPFLYPNLDDSKFNVKIAKKKEFLDTKYDIHPEKDYENIKDYTQALCDSKEFELDPHQMFIRNFMSFQTPYNGILLFHGLGTGKTCSSISVCEEMRSYSLQMGISKKIIIVASPAVQANFKLQLFDKNKLKQNNGVWNIKACIGNKLIKEVNIMNMRGLTRKKIIRQINQLIRQSYMFKGYGEFSNYLDKIMNKGVRLSDSDEIKGRRRSKNLKKEFSNRMLVIDEVHNIRLSKEGKIKSSSENLGRLVTSTQNMKLLLLSATPMFDSYSEIIWILNLLNLNDKRFPISEREIFTKKGSFQVKNGVNIGKELLVQKATGYVSYVRGENPFTFPYRIWPSIARNPSSIFLLSKDGVWSYPRFQLNGGEIIEPLQRVDLVMQQIGTYQNKVYEKLIQYLKSKNPRLNNPEGSVSFTILEAPLQTLNIVYPHIDFSDKEESKMDSDTLGYMYGSKGLGRIMNYSVSTKKNFAYKDKTLRNFGPIFSPELIGKYSGKISYICDQIRKSEGIVFVYSQYIDGGAVPMALALESMGFTRAGDRSPLFKKPQTTPLNALTMRPKENGKPFKHAKYIMITGQTSLTPNVTKELNLATDPENKDGNKVKVIIVSRAGSEGLDFKNIRQMHILDPWYNLNRSEQIIGRAVRSKSHCLLPYEKRNVEIFMYGTQLENKDMEAIDLYVYRLAERKALQIANVTRVLKENAIDCLLNRKGLNFSEEAIARIAPNHNGVSQTLSSGIHIDYILGDKNDSILCDFMDCEYKCTFGDLFDESDLNSDSYNESFIMMNIEKILQRIRNLFKEKYMYRKTDLITEVTLVKRYPIDQIYSALTYLIEDENEFIVDSIGRTGRLVNVGEYYMFQPLEMTSKNIERYDRVAPVPFKRQTIEFVVSDIEAAKTNNINDIVNKLNKSYKNMLMVQKLTAQNKTNWSIVSAWVISNLVKYNFVRFNLKKSELLDILLELAMHHMIDLLEYGEKLLLLKNINNIDGKLGNYIESYFEKFYATTPEYKGVIITDFKKKSNYSILTLIDDTWKIDKNSIVKGLGREVLNTFTVPVDDMNDRIGFMAKLKKYNLIFKTKNTALSAAGRPSKGSSCERGADKKMLIENINLLLSPNKSDFKYIMGSKGGKGARSITSIYNYNEDEIVQHPYERDENGNLLMSKQGNYKVDEDEHVRINTFQLCIELELILRYFNKINKDGKRWFFSSVETIINDIERVGK